MDQALLHGRCSSLELESWIPSRACGPPAPPAQLYTSRFPAEGASVADFYQTQTTASPKCPSSPLGIFPASPPPGSGTAEHPGTSPATRGGHSPPPRVSCPRALSQHAVSVLRPPPMGCSCSDSSRSPSHHMGWAPGDPGFSRVHLPGHLLLSSTPRLTQPFARAPSLSPSLTQTSHIHSAGLESTAEPSQALPAAGDQHCDTLSKKTHPCPAGRGSPGPHSAMPWEQPARRPSEQAGETCSLGPAEPCLSLIDPNPLLPPRGQRPSPCLAQGSSCSPRLRWVRGDRPSSCTSPTLLPRLHQRCGEPGSHSFPGHLIQGHSRSQFPSSAAGGTSGSPTPPGKGQGSMCHRRQARSSSARTPPYSTEREVLGYLSC